MNWFARQPRTNSSALVEQEQTDNLAARTYNQPTDQGFEQHLRARFDEIRKLKSKSVSES